MSQDVASAVEVKFDENPSKPDETQDVSSAGKPDPNSEEFKQAVAKAIDDQFKVTAAWMPQELIKFVVSCPSGQAVLVKHLDVMDLVRADLVEDLDSFQRQLFPSKLDDSGRPVDGETSIVTMTSVLVALKDPKRLKKFIDVTSRLMEACTIKPKVVNDGVALKANEEGQEEPIFGYKVDNIDEQIKLFGKPIPVLKENQVYAGVIGIPDRLKFFTELNKPLEMIAPFRESAEGVADLSSVQTNESKTE